MLRIFIAGMHGASSTLATYKTGLSVREKICNGCFFFFIQIQFTDIFPFFKMFFATFQNFKFSFCFCIAVLAFFRLLIFSFHTFQVFQLQFRINDFFIAYRIDGAFIAQNIFIFKTTDHMKMASTSRIFARNLFPNLRLCWHLLPGPQYPQFQSV